MLVFVFELIFVVFSKSLDFSIQGLSRFFVFPLFLVELSRNILNRNRLFQNILVELPQLLLDVLVTFLPRVYDPRSPRSLQLSFVGKVFDFFPSILFNLHYLLVEAVDFTSVQRQLALVALL